MCTRSFLLLIGPGYEARVRGAWGKVKGHPRQGHAQSIGPVSKPLRKALLKPHPIFDTIDWATAVNTKTSQLKVLAEVGRGAQMVT